MPKNFKLWVRIGRDGQKTLKRDPEVVEMMVYTSEMRVFQRLQSRWKNMPHNKPKREGGRGVKALKITKNY
jgi:hypothetical protein